MHFPVVVMSVSIIDGSVLEPPEFIISTADLQPAYDYKHAQKYAQKCTEIRRLPLSSH